MKWAFIIAMLATPIMADTVRMKSGRDIDCVIIQEGKESVAVRIGYGTMSIPQYAIDSIKRSPVIVEAAPALESGQRVPGYSIIVASLVKQPWASGLQQIPATVIDKGVMRHVPYQSYRCGSDYEVNIYGDPDKPAGIEIGIYRGLLRDGSAKKNCVELLASVLGDKVDIAILRALDLKSDIATRKELTIEITPETATDAYGGWWVSVYDEKQLDAARASDKELKEITAPIVAKPAAQAAKKDVDDPDWTADDMKRARPPTPTPRPRADDAPSGGGGSVYVRGYSRKDGTYVRPHTRRR